MNDHNYHDSSRRAFLFATLAGVTGCRNKAVDQVQPTVPKTLTLDDRITAARSRGVQYLQSKQSTDGAWRSDTYGTFKDGTALTPLILNAILTAAPDQSDTIKRAATYLTSMTKPNGDIAPPSYGFDFALYTAAFTVLCLHHPHCPEYPSARSAWLRYLKDRQLTETLGWKLEDHEYGGWGYSRGIPRKPGPGELIPPLTESNLSATTVAIAALRAASVPKDDPAYAKALVFVRRCQNWNDDPAKRERAFDDGGFFFIDSDAVRNKAGVVGKDSQGNERFHSYGSATADGLRCLLDCGLPESDPRCEAACKWLIEHYIPSSHPGVYADRRESDRMALYYYYSASIGRIPAHLLKINYVVLKRLLAEDLISRQSEDGSWLNPVVANREDEPLIATAFAVCALT